MRAPRFLLDVAPAPACSSFPLGRRPRFCVLLISVVLTMNHPLPSPPTHAQVHDRDTHAQDLPCIRFLHDLYMTRQGGRREMWGREVGEKGGRAGSGWVRCRRAVEINLCIGRRL